MTGAPRRGPSLAVREARLGRLLVTPSLLLVAVVCAYPVLFAVWRSTQEYSLLTPGLQRVAEPWGLGNYATAATDPQFWSALETTLLFTVVSVGAEAVIGMVMALVMHASFRGRAALRAVILVPWSILTVVAAVVWRSVFDPTLGFVSAILDALHVGSGPLWLGSEPYALLALVIADVWKTAPFIALLLLAGLQTIPGEVYEASRIDGATPWQTFWRITLPMLRPALAVALIFRTLDALRIFDLPYVLTKGAFGTNTLSLYSYQILLQNNVTGLGSALCVLTFVVVMTISVFYIRTVGRGLAESAS